jgi:hypothetical protein
MIADMFIQKNKEIKRNILYDLKYHWNISFVVIVYAMYASIILVHIYSYYSLKVTFISVFSTYPILLRHISAMYGHRQVYVLLLKLFHCTSNCISRVNAMLILNHCS